MSETHLTASEAETMAVGRGVGTDLQPGSIVSLEGSLGAGKTAFVRGIAEGMGCDPNAVSSPTFTIIQEYPGPVTLQHVDLYRLAPAEVDELGLDDVLADQVGAIEWPDRWRQMPETAIRVRIEIMGGDARRITIDR